MNLARRLPDGAQQLVASLERLGVEYVFGLPGTQNVALLEALRRSRRLRTVVATHELAASFMAGGYARSKGRPGVLVTIPGPGFTYALTGLAEAMLDSVPIVYIVGAPATSPGTRFQLQSIDQAAMVAPVCKAVLAVAEPGEVAATVARAHALAMAGEPGPVVVEIASGAMAGFDPALAVPGEPAPAAPVATPGAVVPPPAALESVAAMIAAARRIVIYAGQGSLGDPAALQRLAELLGAVVATTTSGRGLIAEDHPQVLACDGRGERLIALLERADLVLALGVKFSHNGAHGFRLPLPRDRLVHVDASAQTLDGHYPARIAVACDVPAFTRELVALLAATGPASDRPAPNSVDGPKAGDWPTAALAAARTRGDAAGEASPEPAIAHAEPPTPAGFFAQLRQALPRDAILVTDSGRHQMLARRYFPILAPGGLLVPTGLQSMGFGLPAAIGAQLAQPKRTVVALVGDGGLVMAGMELLTAVRERVPLIVVVLVDGQYGLIRQQQIDRHGRAHGTALHNPDFARWSASLGAGYLRFDGIDSLRAAVAARRPTLVEVAVGDSPAMRAQQFKSHLREAVLDAGGPGLRAWWRRRRGSRS